MLKTHIMKERIGAAVLLILGLLLLGQGISLRLGSLASFGPGIFPAIIGTAIAVVAAVLIVAPTHQKHLSAAPALPWRAMVFVGLGMVGFAVLVRSAGLVPATIVLVMLASFGDRSVRPLAALLLSVVLASLGVAIFIWGLSMPLLAFRW